MERQSTRLSATMRLNPLAPDPAISHRGQHQQTAATLALHRPQCNIPSTLHNTVHPDTSAMRPTFALPLHLLVHLPITRPTPTIGPSRDLLPTPLLILLSLAFRSPLMLVTRIQPWQERRHQEVAAWSLDRQILLTRTSTGGL